MKTVASRTYTNVALTVLIILLAVLAFRPYLPGSSAYALDMDRDTETTRYDRNAQQQRVAQSLNSQEQNAEATREVAAATRDVAQAIRESAAAQEKIAQSLMQLANTASQ